VTTSSVTESEVDTPGSDGRGATSGGSSTSAGAGRIGVASGCGVLFGSWIGASGATDMSGTTDIDPDRDTLLDGLGFVGDTARPISPSSSSMWSEEREDILTGEGRVMVCREDEEEGVGGGS
jgi:hypothetical protein